MSGGLRLGEHLGMLQLGCARTSAHEVTDEVTGERLLALALASHVGGAWRVDNAAVYTLDDLRDLRGVIDTALVLLGGVPENPPPPQVLA